MLLSYCSTRPRVQKSMKECFVSVGLAKDPETLEFKTYRNHRRGTVAIKKTADTNQADRISFGEVAGEVEMVARDRECVRCGPKRLRIRDQSCEGSGLIWV